MFYEDFSKFFRKDQLMFEDFRAHLQLFNCDTEIWEKVTGDINMQDCIPDVFQVYFA